MTLKPLSLLLAAALGTVSLQALAIDPFKVRDIRVEGLQRTDVGTVFNYLPVKVGDTFDDNKASEAIKALFATGFFNDVRVEAEGDLLIVTVEERPTIAQINIGGSKLLEKDQIKNALKLQNFAEGRIFDQSTLDTAVQELKQEYYSRGRYSVIINTTVTKLDRNRVGVEFSISDGAIAKIQQINIVGNKVFSESDLADEFSLSTGGWLTWYTRSDQYSKPKLSADLEKLRSYYLDRGYIEFNIDSTQVALSENREDIYLTINVSEGEQYKIGEVKIVGDTVVSHEELAKLITVSRGEVFSREKLNKSSAALIDKMADAGYAFANVNAVPDLNKDTHTANFTFYVDPGRKIYVRRINISGNNRTRDEVIRRELRQVESAQYDGAKVKRSKERLQQLDYFDEVTIDTPIVPEATDQVDMNVRVTEKKTGSFNVGVGYGQSEGIVFIMSLSQNNFLGSGKQFTSEVNTSQASKTVSFSLLEPYFTPDGVSLGYSAFLRTVDSNETNTGNYSTTGWGMGLQSGVPISETNRLNFAGNYENLKIKTNTSSPQRVMDFVKRYGDSVQTYSVSGAFGRDSRNSATYPTDGMLSRVNLEFALPNSTVDYYKLSGQNQIFWSPFSPSLTFEWNVNAGYGKGYGNSTFPFYKNFYVGGVDSLRGYNYGTAGPKDENGDGTGGSSFVTNSFEVFFPFPGLKDDKSARLSLFVDSGASWGDGQKMGVSDMRYSAGAAFTWISPIGPIKLSYAKPFKAQTGDKLQPVQFQLGRVF
ncbi:outer membrane protein insertion porin family [Andreprevotia lacus DSM 23236]|jgi:outer membrane protein insertion porin family|uniref:Outer membrane protein assembly factor BamA n=1 Tax=Andreprevotia lacus DSM 23236 TaxID=1121001 RepID=A0A1W1XMK1_9NEIS|nr:outer membrane protein assembly factor BamA [Andreprevotia lacus]SMC24761.1 outer membrane protein insertion porin family [Andreprevotia lacus DSM 23236]